MPYRNWHHFSLVKPALQSCAQDLLAAFSFPGSLSYESATGTDWSCNAIAFTILDGATVDTVRTALAFVCGMTYSMFHDEDAKSSSALQMSYSHAVPDESYSHANYCQAESHNSRFSP